MTINAKNLSLPPQISQEILRLCLNIKTARKRRKISLEDMAQRTSSSISTISRLESGDPRISFEIVLRVLDVLGLLRGLSDFISPDSDSGQLMEEVRNLRQGKFKQSKSVFQSKELDF